MVRTEQGGMMGLLVQADPSTVRAPTVSYPPRAAGMSPNSKLPPRARGRHSWDDKWLHNTAGRENGCRTQPH